MVIRRFYHSYAETYDTVNQIFNLMQSNKKNQNLPNSTPKLYEVVLKVTSNFSIHTTHIILALI